MSALSLAVLVQQAAGIEPALAVCPAATATCSEFSRICWARTRSASATSILFTGDPASAATHSDATLVFDVDSDWSDQRRVTAEPRAGRRRPADRRPDGVPDRGGGESHVTAARRRGAALRATRCRRARNTRSRRRSTTSRRSTSSCAAWITCACRLSRRSGRSRACCTLNICANEVPNLRSARGPDRHACGARTRQARPPKRACADCTRTG